MGKNYNRQIDRKERIEGEKEIKSEEDRWGGEETCSRKKQTDLTTNISTRNTIKKTRLQNSLISTYLVDVVDVVVIVVYLFL